MTRLAPSPSRQKMWETGYRRGCQDAAGGRRADIQPQWGYLAGYDDHKAGTCPCYTAHKQPAAMATISLKGTTYTINKALRAHWRENARLTSKVREYAAQLWQAELIGKRLVTPVRIGVRQILVAGRKPQDLGAQFPVAKAALDGLVDAGGIPDDSPDYVRELTFWAHAVKKEPPGLVNVTAVAVKGETDK